MLHSRHALRNHSVRRYLIIFDGDDTLWMTQHLYDQARTKFLDLMERCGFSRRAARSLFNQTDVQNVSSMGLSKRRFPTSMLQTYRELCLRGNSTHLKRVETVIKSIGNAPFKRKPLLVKDAIATLILLKKKYRIALFTAGPKAVQVTKIRQLGFSRYFDRIEIVPIKTPTTLRGLLQKEHVKPSDAIMVGNSIRSDILPAIEIGVKPLLFVSRTWAYDRSIPLKVRIDLISSLKNLPRQIEERYFGANSR